MRMSGAQVVSIILAMATMVAGCGGGNIFVAANYPPELSLPAEVRTIAVTPFVGQDRESKAGAQMASGLLASKLKSSLSGQYTIVERGNLADIMKELDLADAGITDTGTAAQAGKLLNADAIIIGSVQVAAGEDVETKTSTKYNARGEPYTATTQKLRRTGQVSMTTRMVRPETAEVIISKTSAHDYDSNLRGGFAALFDDNSSVPSAEFITRTLLEECVSDFYKTIAPHVEYFEVKLAGCKTPAAKAGVDFAKAGEFGAALRQFEDGISLDPLDHGAIYNLGVMQMLTGDIAAAKENVDKAMRMKADKKYIQLCQFLRNAQNSSAEVSFRAATGDEVATFKARQKMLKARM